MLKKRVITVLWALPLLIAAIWFDQPLPWFTVLMTVWGLVAVFEVYRISKTTAVPALTVFGLLWTALFIISPHFNLPFLLPLLLAAMVIVPLIMLVLLPNKNGTFISWAWTIAGILYIGWLLSYFVALRGLDDPQTLLLDEGRNWVFLALFTTFASDTAAFFVGRAWGKRRLAPHISPGKTWEGAIAGVFGAILVSLFFILPTPLTLHLNWGQVILLGLLTSTFGQLGDLVESLFKRNMGVKDSSNLIPGHGGFLDRIDSVIFAGIVVYYCAVWAIQ